MHFKLICLKLNPQPNVTSSYATVEWIRTFVPQQRNEHYCTRRLRQILLKQCTTMAHNNMRLCANASLTSQCRNDGDWIGHIDKLIIFGLKWTKRSSKKIHSGTSEKFIFRMCIVASTLDDSQRHRPTAFNTLSHLAIVQHLIGLAFAVRGCIGTINIQSWPECGRQCAKHMNMNGRRLPNIIIACVSTLITKHNYFQRFHSRKWEWEREKSKRSVRLKMMIIMLRDLCFSLVKYTPSPFEWKQRRRCGKVHHRWRGMGLQWIEHRALIIDAVNRMNKALYTVDYRVLSIYCYLLSHNFISKLIFWKFISFLMFFFCFMRSISRHELLHTVHTHTHTIGSRCTLDWGKYYILFIRKAWIALNATKMALAMI